MVEKGWQAWSAEEDAQLLKLRAEGKRVREIAEAMGRGHISVQSRCQKLREDNVGVVGKRGRPRNAVKSVADLVDPAVSLADTPSAQITPKSVAADIEAFESQLADIQETLGLLYALQRKLGGENVSLCALEMPRPQPAQNRHTARLRALKYLREDAA